MASEVLTRELKEFGGSLWSMKNQRKFCDAAIVVDGQRIGVHTVILASSSEFFENAFESSDLAVKEVSFKDVDTETLLALIEYCYTGSITITESNINEVFKMANILSMKAILDNSSKVFKKILNVENSLYILKIVKSGNSETLMSMVLDFIRQNFEKVSLLQDFLDLEYSDMKELLSEDVNGAVITVYNALKKWGKHDISRTNSFVDLLDQIKLECLPRDILLSESQSVCNSNGDCLLKFINALTIENLLHENNNRVKKCSVYHNTLIAVGDNSITISKIIEIFDIDKNKWIEIQYDGLKKNSFSAILTQDKLMMIGGYSSASSNTVQYYNLNTGQEEYLSPMKYARYYSSAVKYGEDVYVIGGSNGSALSYVERWHQNFKSWTTVAPLTNPRERFGVAVLRNEIFAVGGLGKSDTLADVEAYDPINNKWRRITQMNEKRQGHGVAEVNGFLYAVGGYSGSEILKTAERYDPDIQKWTMIQSIEDPRSRLAAGNLNGRLVISGGYLDSKAVSTVEKYDEATHEWKSMPSIKNSRYHHNLIQIPWSIAKDVLSRRVPE